MASASPNPTQLTPPRVAVIDERTGAISREWYRFFLSLLTSTQNTSDAADTQPDANSLMATYDAMLGSLTQEVQTNTSDLSSSLQQQINDVFNATAVTPPSSGGTVTSVDASGGSTGMVFTGGPITTSGTLTLSGTLDVDNGGTGQTSYTNGQLLIGNTTGNTLAKATLTAGTNVSITNGAGSITINATDAFVGTVTSVSVVSANGFAGTVATATTTPAITISTSVTGVLKGNGTAISAASAGTDYVAPGAYTTSGLTMSTIRLLGRTTASTGAAEEISVAGGLTLSGGVLTGASGTVTSVTGTAPVVSSGGSTPAISMPAATTSVNGYLTSTDWTTFNNKGSGSVTSVSGTGTVNGITLTGTVTTSGSLTLGGTLSGVSLTSQVTGTLPVANGGTGQTSYTNGQLLIGNTTGNTLTKATLTAGTNVSITNGAGSITINATDQYVGTVTSVSGTGTVNGITLTGTVTSSGSLTLGGTLSNVSLTTQVTGTLPVANGGTGTATSFTAGSVVFAGASGVYSQNNAQFFWDNSNNRLGIGNASPGAAIDVTGNIRLSAASPNIELNNGGPMVYSPAANTLAFATGGGPSSPINRFQVGPAGQWGIAGATYGSAGQVFTSGGASASPTWTTPTTGTVTSVSGTGTVNGITLTGTVTSTGSLTLGGTLSGVSLTSQVSGTLPVGNGGTGTATAFTSGSVVFAGASGVYAQNNANLFWDDTNNRLGLGTAAPAATLDTRGALSIGGAANASLHINTVYGGNGRLTQMSPASSNTNALNIIASKSSGGADQWYAWGVTAANVFNIQQGTVLGTAGLNITSNNQVLINTSTVSSAALNHTLEVNGDFFTTGSAAGLFWANRSATPSSGANWYGWYTTGGTIFLYNPAAGNIASINASTGAYTALSDVAKKKDFEPSSIGLDAVMALKPTLFRMDTDADDAPKQLGFIAQEVKDHIPQAYVEEQNVDAAGIDTTYIGLNDRPIIAALVKAVQELEARVAQLEG